MGKAPLFVRPPTDAERQVLADSLRAPDAFVVRRAQIILASAQGESVGLIAPRVGFSGQAVRNVIRGFNAHGVAVLQPRSRRNQVIYTSFDTAGAEALRTLLHQSPRLFACHLVRFLGWFFGSYLAPSCFHFTAQKSSSVTSIGTRPPSVQSDTLTGSECGTHARLVSVSSSSP